MTPLDCVGRVKHPKKHVPNPDLTWLEPGTECFARRT